MISSLHSSRNSEMRLPWACRCAGVQPLINIDDIDDPDAANLPPFY